MCVPILVYVPLCMSVFVPTHRSTVYEQPNFRALRADSRRLCTPKAKKQKPNRVNIAVLRSAKGGKGRSHCRDKIKEEEK